MLSEKFKELLNIEEERLLAIRSDCAQFVAGDSHSAAVHQRVLEDVDLLLTMTRNFRDTDAQTKDEKQAALNAYLPCSRISMDLSSFLFSNSHCAGSFRNATLQKHAALINVIAREQILTNVNAGWAIIEDVLAASRARTGEAAVSLAPGKDVKIGAGALRLVPSTDKSGPQPEC